MIIFSCGWKVCTVMATVDSFLDGRGRLANNCSSMLSGTSNCSCMELEVLLGRVFSRPHNHFGTFGRLVNLALLGKHFQISSIRFNWLSRAPWPRPALPYRGAKGLYRPTAIERLLPTHLSLRLFLIHFARHFHETVRHLFK